jgi:alcohol dehydrogenase class IV
MNFETPYSYNFPTSIRFGKGVIDELASHLKKQGLSRPLFVSDTFIAELDVFKNVLKQIETKGLSSVVFTDIDKNPVKRNVLAGVDVFHNEGADSIVGFGGGASMDVARAIALKANHERDLFDFDDALGGDKYCTEEIPYFVTVPTTSGTGSEVGRSTVISEDDTHRKRILFSPRLMAKIVFADPGLTMALPAHITAATGVDALTHNIEAYVAKGFSPLCDGIAIEGIKLISESLVKATKKPDLESRGKMMMAALMGATAFQKGLGVVHSCAHPLSTLFDTHHGLANAIMLPYGIAFNEANLEVKARYDFLAKLIGTNDLASWVKELNEQLELPNSLRSIDVGVESIDALSELALADACHHCNPRTCTLEDFKNIYTEAMR